MKKKEIIIIGHGGHSDSCIDVILKENKYKILGYVVKDKKNYKNFASNFNYPILGSDKELNLLKKKYNYAFIGIGQIKNSKDRIFLYKKLLSIGFILPAIISPIAYVSKKSIVGDGSIIMHHSMINCNVKIGINCIINSKALIEHGCIIGDNTHISTTAVINGNVKIGKNCFIGSNSTIFNNIEIGNGVIIRAGSVISKNIKSNSIVKK